MTSVRTTSTYHDRASGEYYNVEHLRGGWEITGVSGPYQLGGKGGPSPKDDGAEMYLDDEEAVSGSLGTLPMRRSAAALAEFETFRLREGVVA